MTRLIDADDLEKTLHEIIVKKGFTFSHGNGDFSLVISSENLKDLITNAPTIEADSGDAVGIVVDASYYDGKVSKYNPNGNLVKEHGIDYREQDVTKLPVGTKLYTSPQKRQWVELNREQLDRIYLNNNSLADIAKAISDALKEVNHHVAIANKQGEMIMQLKSLLEDLANSADRCMPANNTNIGITGKFLMECDLKFFGKLHHRINLARNFLSQIDELKEVNHG